MLARRRAYSHSREPEHFPERTSFSLLGNTVFFVLFSAFFARPDTFTLGVCNGCQMLSACKEIIPGAGTWPRFVRNRSDQFEARLSLVEVAKTAQAEAGPRQ